ncbi:MAG: UDP-N-acetylmuramate--L-alanine ligase [Parachlamydiaceae bacterium]|nr:UDP-N-acetylmuramate--L-alanine ligase [Parachlamydiaceae bacterium]
MTQKHYHFIGIGGIGMSGLARILLSKNVPVSGSDIAINYTIEGLAKAGATIHKGQSADVINPNMTVIYSSDIKADNPEYATALKLNCNMLHRSDLLAELVQGYQSFAVAGTHGKTTTSALLSTVLFEAGVDPSFAVGGMLPQFGSNARHGEGQYFAFEADESDRTFLKYHPYGAIVTNIDNDHLNNYEGSEVLLIEAFKKFMSQVTSPAHLFWCGDDSYLKKLNQPGVTYGFSDGCDWKATNYRQKGFSVLFDIDGGGRKYKDVELTAIGRYNALNALAVFGLARTLGIDEESIRRGFKVFQGVMRRCEKKGGINGVEFLDDYAHHPTEITVTLQAIRQAVGEKRLIALFQPHRYSRTNDCLGMYGSIFDAADELIITDIFASGETPIANLTHEIIMEEIRSVSSVAMRYVPRSALSHMLAQFVQPHDVVVTLGAGDVTKVAPETLNFLEKQEPRKINLGLCFGGSETEHEISIRSSENFRTSLNSHYYNIAEFGITKNGTWIAGSDVKKKLEKILDSSSEDPLTSLSPEVLQKVHECEVMIPVLHGPYGEDGMIQGLFDMLGKAYVGCDHRSAAICMDKVLCKKIVSANGILTSPSVDFSSSEWIANPQTILNQIIEKLHFPVFVKPPHCGSAVGVRKVDRKEQLEEAINFAFCFDTHILVENGIVGREIEFAVLGNDEIVVFPPGEILTGGKVYDYAAKYSDNCMGTDTCAQLSKDLIEKGRKVAELAYRAMGCTGLARVDFFLDAHGVYWFNEINPMPGFTSISLYPKMCEANGLEVTKLMDQFVILALHRKRRLDRINRGYHLAMDQTKSITKKSATTCCVG